MAEQFKAVNCGDPSIDGEDYETFFVVPMHVTAMEVMASETGMSDAGFECVCECFSWDSANLVAKLLNEHSLKEELH